MKYPPLNALRAFESAARHKSFVLAAKELHVSAASVSRYIKLLEADLNCILFVRQTNAVELTEAGAKYWVAVRQPLQTIVAVSKECREKESQRSLHIVAIPAIAETWLVSHLWNFQQQHRNIEINLVLDDQPVNLRNNDTTIWLSHTDGNLSDVEVFAMPEDKLSLICNPAIARNLKEPADIMQYPLLVDVDWRSDWESWLLAANLPLTMDNCIEFERYSMVVNAAIAGTGVAIGHTALLETYLQQGVLIRPFSINATPQKQFYAVVAKNPQCKAVQEFVNWFSAESVFTV